MERLLKKGFSNPDYSAEWGTAQMGMIRSAAHRHLFHPEG
jgi:hypothetical protein